jgi:hypothetical protein
MPTLHWIGKERVINHHQEVPFKVLDKQYGYNLEESDAPSGNNIIHGDNLEALKSLLREYEGNVNWIAEVFNAIARINLKNYKRNLPIDPENQLTSKQIDDLDFKRSYRGSEDYIYHLNQFKAEFEVYSKDIKIVDNELDLDIA